MARRSSGLLLLAREVDYSPTEVAKQGLLGTTCRSTIYKWINRGDISVIHDQYGHERITLEEIERWRESKRKASEAEATEEGLKAEIRRHLAKAAAKHRAAINSADALIAPLKRARREALARIVDPRGECSPAELERRIALEKSSQMDKLTAKRLQKQLLRLPYANEEA